MHTVPGARLVTIIVNWRTPGASAQAARRAEAFSDGVILVDCSRDISTDSLPAGVSYVPSPNLGYAGGNNLGAEVAFSDYDPTHLLILNPDINVPVASVERLLRTSIELGCGVVGPVLFRKIGPEEGVERLFGYEVDKESGRLSNYRRPAATSDPYPVGCVCGAAMLIDAVAFQEVGGLNSRLFTFYEEIDLSEALRERGRQTCVEPRAIAVHGGSASTAMVPRACSYYLARNAVLVARRWPERFGTSGGGAGAWRRSVRGALVQAAHLEAGRSVAALRGGIAGLLTSVERDGDPFVAAKVQAYEVRE